MSKELNNLRAEMRRLFANYYKSEGCSCCQNVAEHKKAEAEIGKLLKVEKYSDGSGYNFSKYATKTITT